MRGNNRLAFATPLTWRGYAGRNFETELASFWCLVFGLDPARGVMSASAGRKKRAATVDVFVWFAVGRCAKQRPLVSRNGGARRFQAMLRRYAAELWICKVFKE